MFGGGGVGGGGVPGAFVSVGGLVSDPLYAGTGASLLKSRFFLS
jgi:hypothetical protein